MSDYDIIILGGGPGGMSALLWCHSLGVRGVLLEQAPELGGQMLQMFHQVVDYPGRLAADGRELRDHFVEHLQQLQLDFRTACRIEEVDLAARRVRCNGEWLQGRALILATGARARRLEIPGEAAFAYHFDPHDHAAYAGQPVCVIGGGDSAVEASLILARVCPSVMLIHRSDNFRARPAWLHEARSTPNLTILPQIIPIELRGRSRVESLVLSDTRTGEQRELPAAAVFIRVGTVPNTEFLRGHVELDEAGYIRTDARQRTSREQVYAVGDVCKPVCWSVATAVGHGAVAVKDAVERLRSQSGLQLTDAISPSVLTSR